MELADLSALIGSPSAPIPLVGTNVGIDTGLTPQPEFVPPTLSCLDGSDTASAVLISAPAAVGKTMLAKELAARTSNPYWDLGQFTVAHHFVEGALLRAFGTNVTDMLGALSAGEGALVLDSLDETYVASGDASFIGFLTTTGEMLASFESPRPVVVMLARDETADYAAEFLEEAGASLLRLRIDYFDRKRSFEMVDHFLDLRGDTSKERFQHRYETAREIIFSLVAKLFAAADPWLDPEAQSFAGYAPVLAAIADYLHAVDGGQYNDAIEQLQGISDTDSQSLWTLLQRIVLGILKREQRKLLEACPGVFPAAVSGDFFSPEEQLALLLQPKVGTGIQPPSGLSPEQQRELVNAVRQQLDDHPFLAAPSGRPGDRFVNSVFRDYAFAHALFSTDRSLMDAVVEATRPEGFQPTPMLAFFAFLLGTQLRSRIPLLAFPPIYESLATERNAYRLDLVDADGAGLAEATIRKLDDIGSAPSYTGEQPARGGSDVVASITLTGVQDASLVFRRRITHLLLDHPDAVVQLGEASVSAQLGPSADITCDSFRVAAPEVTLVTQDGPVSISAKTFLDSSRGAPPRLIGDERDIVISAPRLTYPWDQYQAQVDGNGSGYAEEMFEACEELRQLLKWFKGGIRGGLTYHAPTLDSAARSHKVSGELLEFLKERGVLTQRGHDYILDPDEARLNIQEIRLREISDDLAPFLCDYNDWKAGRRHR